MRTFRPVRLLAAPGRSLSSPIVSCLSNLYYADKIHSIYEVRGLAEVSCALEQLVSLRLIGAPID